MKTAIYAGSFDPFTNGHLDILLTAASIFDTVHLVFASNPQKTRSYDATKQAAALEDHFITLGLINIKIVILPDDKLLIDYAKENNIKFFIRGVRNINDYEYERQLAESYSILYPKAQVIYINSRFPYLSSSFVREMIRYNKDWQTYVPKPITEIIQEELNIIENLHSAFNGLFTHH